MKIKISNISIKLPETIDMFEDHNQLREWIMDNYNVNNEPIEKFTDARIESIYLRSMISVVAGYEFDFKVETLSDSYINLTKLDNQEWAEDIPHNHEIPTGRFISSEDVILSHPVEMVVNLSDDVHSEILRQFAKSIYNDRMSYDEAIRYAAMDILTTYLDIDIRVRQKPTPTSNDVLKFAVGYLLDVADVNGGLHEFVTSQTGFDSEVFFAKLRDVYDQEL